MDEARLEELVARADYGVTTGNPLSYSSDVRELVAEVRRLQEERDEYARALEGYDGGALRARLSSEPKEGER